MTTSPTKAGKHTQNIVNVLLGNSVRARTKTDPVGCDAYCFNVLAAIVRFIAAFSYRGMEPETDSVNGSNKSLSVPQTLVIRVRA
jgi:hypothetical protein